MKLSELNEAIRASGKNVRISLHIQANAKVPGLVGFHGGRLKLKVSARPVEGAANLEVLEIISIALNVPKSRIKILSGQLAKTKIIEIEDIALGEVSAALLGYLR